MNTEPARSEPEFPSESSADLPEERRQVRVRRAPKYANFALLGALLGAVAAFVLTVAIPPDAQYARDHGFPEYSQVQIFGFLLLIGLVAGIALALTAAIVIDRLSGSRSALVEADKVDVQKAPVVEAPVRTQAADAASAPAIEHNPPHTPDTTNEGNA